MAYTTIDKPTDYFNTKTYTGTATSSGDTQAVTGVGFQPDWVWIKNRDGAYQHVLYDVIRGVNKELRSSQTNAEIDSGTNGYLSAFNSDGFTTTRGTNTGNHVNANGSGFVSWNWLAGGTASSNTNGSITSSVSANQDAGFSIVTYDGTGSAGATVGHGLGVAPSMILAKKMDGAASNWAVYHKSLGATKYLILNSTTASVTSNTRWNNVEPTSSVFTVGSSGDVNNNGETVVAYCFAEKQGYSKFGSYTGNGNADGTFVYTGFKPAFIIHKRTDATGNWNMHDSTRSLINTADERLYSNLSNAEDSGGDYGDDILSNGFKIRTTEASWNASGGSYIYMAFAENPFVTSTGIPTTAR